jgi:hypothetical protein
MATLKSWLFANDLIIFLQHLRAQYSLSRLRTRSNATLQFDAPTTGTLRSNPPISQPP